MMSLKNRKYSIIITFLLGATICQGQFIPRFNYGAFLEPQDAVLHGAGQSPDAFRNYWNVFPGQKKPMIYMVYVGLRSISNQWTAALKTDLLTYHKLGYFVIPQIGLSMTTDGQPQNHYEDDVAAGLMDEDIDHLIQGLRYLAMPAYLRIGYEFNGRAWNGYEPETYKAAFIRITEKLRVSQLEVATVWDFSLDGDMAFMDFYPGDDVVDWWGTNPFSKEHIANVHNLAFLDSAWVHQKPVLIGESTPRYVGVLQGQTSWDLWFDPFFDLIHSQPGLKMLGYINWNWTQYPYWSNWGDARLEMNAIVSQLYIGEMDSTEYFHATNESDFRNLLGYDDVTAPGPIMDLQAGEGDSAGFAIWNPILEPQELAHYIIYENEAILDYILDPFYKLKNTAGGESRTIQVAAMDRAGNLGPLSDEVTVTLPVQSEKIQNGEFDSGKANWNLLFYEGGWNASWEVDGSGVLSGPNSAKINLNQSPGTNYYIQFAQIFDVFADHDYEVQFQARADRFVTVELFLQQNHAPFQWYLREDVDLDVNPRTFSFQTHVSKNDQVNFTVMMGHTAVSTIWIDSVSVIETNPSPVIQNDPIASNGNIPRFYKLYDLYPNPFNGSTTLHFELKEGGPIRIDVYDMRGRWIQELVNEVKNPGLYTVHWDGDQYDSGLYLILFQYHDLVEVRKAIMIQ